MWEGFAGSGDRLQSKLARIVLGERVITVKTKIANVT
jgi:hypothetical protein